MSSSCPLRRRHDASSCYMSNIVVVRSGGETSFPAHYATATWPMSLHKLNTHNENTARQTRSSSGKLTASPPTHGRKQHVEEITSERQERKENTASARLHPRPTQANVYGEEQPLSRCDVTSAGAPPPSIRCSLLPVRSVPTVAAGFAGVRCSAVSSLLVGVACCDVDVFVTGVLPRCWLLGCLRGLLVLALLVCCGAVVWVAAGSVSLGLNG